MVAAQTLELWTSPAARVFAVLNSVRVRIGCVVEIGAPVALVADTIGIFVHLRRIRDRRAKTRNRS